MPRYYCTYFDRNYLVKGLALIDSLRRHERAGFRLYVVCLDEMTRLLLTRLSLPEVVTVPVHEIEQGDDALRAAKADRTQVEYYWTLTPTIILRLLEREPSIDVLTYLDADLYVFSDPQPIFDELGTRAILIHEHRFSPAQRHLATHNGIYNVGWLSFRRNAAARTALEWWRARCLEWCRAQYENGKMGDQMYLNDWPTRFGEVVVLRHIGGGVGPWNHDRYAWARRDDGIPTVDGQPVIFYHFHSFTCVNAAVVLPVKHPHYPLPQGALGLCFLPYVRAIEKAHAYVRAVEPTFEAGMRTEVEVTEHHTFLAQHQYAAGFAQQGLPHTVHALDAEWDLYAASNIRATQTSHGERPAASTPPPASVSSGGGSTSGRLPICEVSPEARLQAQMLALATISVDCERLERMMRQVGTDPSALGRAVQQWVETLPAESAQFRHALQGRSLGEIACLPERVRLGGGYVQPRIEQLLQWLFGSKETTNFTYDLTDLNREQLAWFVAGVASITPSQAMAYMDELEQDAALRAHVRTKTLEGAFKTTADSDARYGRRAGWYALVRALKPRVVVETGVDKGLGTCVLAAALLKNRAEGAVGRLYATDINPKAGYLLSGPYAEVGRILYGDSIDTLRRLDATIDLFIADSAHETEYEAREYACVAEKLAPTALVLSDNAHVSPALAAFAHHTGRRYTFFREQPKDHFYPGAGIGAAVVATGARTASATHAPLACSARETSGGPAPRISVLVSSYNAQAHIWECLEDLQRQTIAKDLEIIVVDAASPQHERVVIEAFQQKYANITFVRTPTRIGVYAAWNLALRLARGTYVTPFSTNDRLSPDAYARLAQELDANPEVMLVYGDTHVTKTPHERFEAHTRVATWRWPDYSYEHLQRECLVGPHPMWRRAVHADIGYFDESYLALGDQEFWLRMGARYALRHIPVVTGLYWMSADGLSNRPELAGPEQERLRRAYPSTSVARAATASSSNPVAVGSDCQCSVIIPVWNKCELTQQCIVALAETTNNVSWELIVVDNGSTDETPTFLSTLGGDVRVIRNDENLGFAKACNQGAAVAKGQYLVFLNNDTIPQQGWLSEMVKEVETHPEVTVVGSKLLYEDSTVQHAGVVFSKVFQTPYHIYRGVASRHPIVNRRREFQAVTAACMLVRRHDFDAVGGFDEGYRNGFEDADLCLKIRERGGRIVYQPASVLYHLESQTPGRKAHDSENGDRLKARWGGLVFHADEDRYYLEDELAQTHYEEDGKMRFRVEHLADSVQRTQWQVVSAIEACGLRKDLDGMRACLAKPTTWPADLITLQWAAALCTVAGVPQYGEAFWTRILELGEDASARVALAQAAVDRGDHRTAATHLDAALKHHPEHGSAWFVKGVMLMSSRSFAEAATAFERAIRYGADARKARLGLCMAASGQQQFERAWKLCDELISAYPDDQDVLHWLIRAAAELQRWLPLSEHLATYVARNPVDLSARFAYAGALVRTGRTDLAKREYEAIKALNPTFDGLSELAAAVSGAPSVQAA
ncbi:MAG: glycosyltransferase [Nitrospiraceae bacterium]